MNLLILFFLLINIIFQTKAIPAVNKDCFTWELCDVIGCTDKHNCWVGHKVGSFGDCDECRSGAFKWNTNYECFSKNNHYLECKCLSFANPNGCYSSTTQYAKITFEKYYGINTNTKSNTNQIDLFDLNTGMNFVEGVKNLCKVIDATKDIMDFIDNPFKKLVEDATHKGVEFLVNKIVQNTPLKKFEGIADYISIGINFAIDRFLFGLRNLGKSQSDTTELSEIIDLADKFNQKRGIRVIKEGGYDEFSEEDYFGYIEYSAILIRRNKFKSESNLSKKEIDDILSNSKFKKEDYFIETRIKTKNSELNKLYNFNKITVYGYNNEELATPLEVTDFSSITKIKYYLFSTLFIIVFL